MERDKLAGKVLPIFDLPGGRFSIAIDLLGIPVIVDTTTGRIVNRNEDENREDSDDEPGAD